jgi:hypothetical protein
MAEKIRAGWPENNVNKITLLLVIKNQEKNIEGIVRGLMNLGSLNNIRYQVVLVDKGSQDDTLKILYKLSLEYPAVTIVTTYYRFSKESILTVIQEKCQGDIIYYFNILEDIKPWLLLRTIHSLLQGNPETYVHVLKKMDFYTINKKVYANN